MLKFSKDKDTEIMSSSTKHDINDNFHIGKLKIMKNVELDTDKIEPYDQVIENNNTK